MWNKNCTNNAFRKTSIGNNHGQQVLTKQTKQALTNRWKHLIQASYLLCNRWIGFSAPAPWCNGCRRGNSPANASRPPLRSCGKAEENSGRCNRYKIAEGSVSISRLEFFLFENWSGWQMAEVTINDPYPCSPFWIAKPLVLPRVLACFTATCSSHNRSRMASENREKWGCIRVWLKCDAKTTLERNLCAVRLINP